MLREDRTLLKYPVIAGVAVLVLIALIGLPLAFQAPDRIVVGDRYRRSEGGTRHAFRFRPRRPE